MGALCCDELVKLKVEDIEDLQTIVLIKISNTKTNKLRSFTILGGKYLKLYRTYVSLRLKDFKESRFFIKYKGKCARVVVGIHKLGQVAQEVAKYLNLANASEYTGHCLRRTSAALLVNSGGDLVSLKRIGG